MTDQEHPTTEIVPIAELPQSVQPVPPDEFPNLDETEPGMSLAPEYREFETEGETARALFIGFTSMNSKNQGKQIPVAVFQERDRIWVNAGANLVQQVATLKPRTAVQVTYKGKEKTGSGNNVKVFDVRLLVRKGSAPKANGLTLAEIEQAWNDHPGQATWTALCDALGATSQLVNATFPGGVSAWMKTHKRTPAQAARALADAVAF